MALQTTYCYWLLFLIRVTKHDWHCAVELGKWGLNEWMSGAEIQKEDYKIGRITNATWRKRTARWSHKSKIVGSSPTVAIFYLFSFSFYPFFFFLFLLISSELIFKINNHNCLQTIVPLFFHDLFSAFQESNLCIKLCLPFLSQFRETFRIKTLVIKTSK